MLSAFPSSPAFDEACHLCIRTLNDFSGDSLVMLADHARIRAKAARF